MLVINKYIEIFIGHGQMVFLISMDHFRLKFGRLFDI